MNGNALIEISALFEHLDAAGQRHRGRVWTAEPLDRAATIGQIIADTRAVIQSSLSEDGETVQDLRIIRFSASIDAAPER